MMSLRWPAAMALLAGALALGPVDARAAVTEDQFVARSTSDLVALCTAEPSDRLYTAAVNFCHGFGAGTYGVLATAQKANGKVRLFCMSQNEPTRNEAIASFVSWARARPERGAMPPVDAIAAYLVETYPCPAQSTRPAPRRTP